MIIKYTVVFDISTKFLSSLPRSFENLSPRRQRFDVAYVLYVKGQRSKNWKADCTKQLVIISDLVDCSSRDYPFI